jgi:hypothetical protein
MENETKNQHFISQVEQRLNSCNPDAKKKNQKIYSFKIIGREDYQLEKEGKKSIENNLSLLDLFSFDVVDKSTRKNLESSFCQYEDNIESNTISLISKLKTNNNDVKKEIVNLFASKLLNFLRNPYCIEKVLNTIGMFSSFTPLNPDHTKIYERVKNGSKPQQYRLCHKFGITADEYNNWLKALFIMLMRSKDHNLNMFEHIIKSLYENQKYFIKVVVFQYIGEHSNKSPLLSDRGFTLPSDEDGCLFYSFNLCSSAFIGYAFVDIERQNIVDAPNKIKELFIKESKNVQVRYELNNLDALESYNKNTIYQAKEKVYCACDVVYGL